MLRLGTWNIPALRLCSRYHATIASRAPRALDRPVTSQLQSAVSDDVELEEVDKTELEVQRLIASLRRYDDAASVLGSGLVKDTSRKLSVEEMESPEDTTSRPANRWRGIVYNEGELDKSNLSLPPSKKNPHPFDPNDPAMKHAMPPTHARSMAAFVNHRKALQNLLDLGVDLLDIDTKTKLGRQFVRMDWKKDMFPRLSWLVRSTGVDHELLGSYITRNPYFLTQNLEDLKARVNYLVSKNFTKEQIAKVVIENRYWLNTDITTTDRRLGWLQRQFGLTGDEIRSLIVKEPRVIMFGLGPLQRLVLLFNKELRFARQDLKRMLMEDPRLFMMDYDHVVMTYNYLSLVMGIPNELIVEYPLALRCSVSAIRRRHEFLKRLHKDVYMPELPGYVSLQMLLHPSDKTFAERIAKVKVAGYDRFIKSL